jgi:hypothetical protein
MQRCFRKNFWHYSAQKCIIIRNKNIIDISTFGQRVQPIITIFSEHC